MARRRADAGRTKKVCRSQRRRRRAGKRAKQDWRAGGAACIEPTPAARRSRAKASGDGGEHVAERGESGFCRVEPTPAARSGQRRGQRRRRCARKQAERVQRAGGAALSRHRPHAEEVAPKSTATAVSTQASGLDQRARRGRPVCMWPSTKPMLDACKSRAEANGDSGEQAGERSRASMQTAQHRADAGWTRKPRRSQQRRRRARKRAKLERRAGDAETSRRRLHADAKPRPAATAVRRQARKEDQRACGPAPGRYWLHEGGAPKQTATAVSRQASEAGPECR